MFVWVSSNMSGIDTKVMSHCLVIHSSISPVAQRKRKVGEENRASIDEEVKKLSSVGFITKTKYPTWLVNVVLVRKANKNGEYVWTSRI